MVMVGIGVYSNIHTLTIDLPIMVRVQELGRNKEKTNPAHRTENTFLVA